MPTLTPSEPATDEAVTRAFFNLIDQIQIVAIHPDRVDVFGGNFATETVAAIEFCQTYSGQGFNLYWTVNRVRDSFTGKKPKKADIIAARFCHVDIDPPKHGGKFDKQQVADFLMDHEAPPSFVIDSGNGLQALWRLDGPHQNLDAVEYINRQIAEYYQADHCHNADRLFRIPGFTNFPNAKKRTTGRRDKMASILVADTGQVYEAADLTALFPEAKPQQPEQLCIGDLGATVLEDWDRELLTPADLGLTPGSMVYEAIIRPQGDDRSRSVFRAARLLAYEGKTDGDIAGILLNPELQISEHFYVQKYPLRAVVRILQKIRADCPYVAPLKLDFAAIKQNIQIRGTA